MLRVPPTASNMVEWVRLAANAINGLIGRGDSAAADAAQMQAALDALDGRTDSLEGRTDALETFAAAPFTVPSVVLAAGPLPAAPAKGETVYDEADEIVKTWDGSAWKAHW